MGADIGDAGAAGTPLRVFLSYRRSDDVNFIGRFHDRLMTEFGEENVFRDLDSLHPGSNFSKLIKAELRRIDAVVAMIGPTWSARVRQPGDFVALEIGEALKRGCPVIPILIDDTALPTSDELPDQLRGLLELNAVAIRPDPDFRRDAKRAIEGLREEAEAFRAREVDEELRAAAVIAAEQVASQRRQRVDELAREREASELEVRRLEAKAHASQLDLERQRLDQIVEDERQADAALADATAAVTAAVAAARAVSPEPLTTASVGSTPETSGFVPIEDQRPPVGDEDQGQRRPLWMWLVLGLAIAGLAAVAIALLVNRSGEPMETGDCAPKPGMTVRFCESFDGDALDPQRWEQFDNAGVVTVANGEVTLASNGPSFPYVISNANPFPSSDVYRLTIGYRYKSIAPWGNGVQSQDVRPDNEIPGIDTPGNKISKVWQDERSSHFKNDCTAEEAVKDEANTDPHVVQFDHVASGDHSITVDEVQRASCVGIAKAIAIWFGSPNVPEIPPDDCICQWNELSIQFIRIDVPS
jgi:hypothetical protein